jgi:hypothetical protein
VKGWSYSNPDIVPEAPMSESTPSPEQGEGEDEVRRKFREALERKQSHARSGSAHQGGPKGQNAHGPAANKRTFRRKSG